MVDAVWCAVWTEARSRDREVWGLRNASSKATSGGWHALLEAFDVSQGDAGCDVV